MVQEANIESPAPASYIAQWSRLHTLVQEVLGLIPMSGKAINLYRIMKTISSANHFYYWLVEGSTGPFPMQSVPEFGKIT